MIQFGNCEPRSFSPAREKLVHHSASFSILSFHYEQDSGIISPDDTLITSVAGNKKSFSNFGHCSWLNPNEQSATGRGRIGNFPEAWQRRGFSQERETS